MAVPVLWAAPAIEDLKAILSYVAQDSLARAEQVRDRIKAAAGCLSDFPFRGQVVSELGDPKCRQIVVYSYRIICDVCDEAVTIVAVIHGARLLKKRALRKRRMRR